MVSVVSVKITRKSPTRKRFASTPTNAFTLLACDDALSAYCLILVRINLARFACLRRAVAAVRVKNRFHRRLISYRDTKINL
jgi:hypothetical protein